MSIEIRSKVNENLRKTLGKQIVDYMVDHQLTQEEISIRAGLSRNIINQLINSKHTEDLIQPRTIGKLNSMFRGEYGSKAREKGTKV